MQLTRFDRWLREKFVYQIHIQTLRAPESIPPRVRVVELPDIPGKRFKFLFITSNSKSADTLIRHLKENNQMYASQIVDRDAWYVPFIAPKDKSVTWWLFSIVVIASAAFFILIRVKILFQDEEFRENIQDAIEILKG